MSTGSAPQAPEERPRGLAIFLGRPFGIPIYMTPGALLIGLIIVYAWTPTVRPELGSRAYIVTTGFAILLYASILLHELAHSLAAKRFGLPVRRIVLVTLGGASELEQEPQTPLREFVVAVVGPLTSLVLGGIGLLARLAVGDGGVLGRLVSGFAIANLLVGAFNLLPGVPLDGGRLLRAGVWKVTGRASTGTIAAAWGGRAIACAILVGPYVWGSIQHTRPTTTDLVWSVLLFVFIWSGASATIQMQRLRDRLPSLKAGALTRRALGVAGDLPLSEALRQAHEAGAGALVVVDPAGKPTGLVNEETVIATPERRRPWVTVSTVARALESGLTISADLAGEELVRALHSTPASEYLVMTDEGKVYGVLARVDVERAFAR